MCRICKDIGHGVTRRNGGACATEKAMMIITDPQHRGQGRFEYLGVVAAQGVLGVNVFKDVTAGMRNIFGGRSKSYENELASGVSDSSWSSSSKPTSWAPMR